MRLKLYFIGVMLFPFYLFAQVQPGTLWTTPVRNLNLIPSNIIIPERFQGQIDPKKVVFLPVGWAAQVFYIGGLSKPRFLEWGPDSTLFVADLASGKILALEDKTKSGIADQAKVVASGIYANNIQFYNGSMYACETNTAWKLDDKDGDGIYETKTALITNIDSGTPSGNHYTRTMQFDKVNKKLYIHIGSVGNVDRTPGRALIMQYNDDGTGGRVFASGVRNSVGLTLNPNTGKIWATNNGSDRQGDDTPPEWIDIIRDGGYYGFPVAYGYQTYFDFNKHPDYTALLPITKADSDLVKKMANPCCLIQAHSAPMQMAFTNSSIADEYKNGAFVGLRGSWNRTIATGNKFIYLHFANPNDTVVEWVADFMKGFTTDSVNLKYWGRAVGVALDNKGAIYVTSDDSARVIFKVFQSNKNDVPPLVSPVEPKLELSLNPNIVNSQLNINFVTKSGQLKYTFEIYDNKGNLISSKVFNSNGIGEYSQIIELNNYNSGQYYLVMRYGENVISKQFQVER